MLPYQFWFRGLPSASEIWRKAATSLGPGYPFFWPPGRKWPDDRAAVTQPLNQSLWRQWTDEDDDDGNVDTLV